MCAFYFFWLSASHGLRLGMDGMLLALCDHGLVSVRNNFSTSNYVITTLEVTVYGVYGVFKNRNDLPVDVYRCCAAVPHTTRQRYYNKAARQE